MIISALRIHLSAAVHGGSPETLLQTLKALRTADFRQSGNVLADPAFWQGIDFWTFATALVQADSRAYLGTMLKAAVRVGQGTATDAFAEACTTIIDRRKALDALLPLAETPEEVTDLLTRFRATSADPDLQPEPLLLRCVTPAASFVLFQHLRAIEDSPDLLRRYGVALIRRGDRLAFNLASILQAYFDLAPLPGTFSLHLEPFEFSRLDTSYDTFHKIIRN